jgi:hypothetical protein
LCVSLSLKVLITISWKKIQLNWIRTRLSKNVYELDLHRIGVDFDEKRLITIIK